MTSSPAMHPLELLRAQHGNLAKLIDFLELQPSLLPDAQASHAGLLLDVLVYLTQYPDVTHHPVEDRMARRLIDAGALSQDQCAELERQHAALAQEGAALLRDVEGAMRQESVSMELVARNSVLYAERLRENMAFEESVLFPAAARALVAADWHAIAPGPQEDDPLFANPVDRRFAELHRAIAAQAQCACEATPQ